MRKRTAVYCATSDLYASSPSIREATAKPTVVEVTFGSISAE